LALLTIRRTIAAPPSLVFAIYTDASRMAEWQPGVIGVMEQTGPLDRAGSTYILDQPGPRLRIAILRVEQPSLHQQLEQLGLYRWIGTARFEPLPGGRTRFSYEYAPRGLVSWLLSPLMLVSALVFGRAEFSRLKTVAESTAVLDEKVASSRPKPRSLGMGSSGRTDTTRRAGDERPEPRSWR
jgi:hypothetical protein